jgi:hypothetical protein
MLAAIASNPSRESGTRIKFSFGYADTKMAGADRLLPLLLGKKTGM